MKKNLKYLPYGNCYALIENDTITLVSYTTKVCIIKDNKLYCTGTYSQTTRRHIGKFLREYGKGACYYDAKAVAYSNDYYDLIDRKVVRV